MTRLTARLSAAALSLMAIAAPANAQSTASSAQCDTMMMVGTQNYSAEAVAACMPYFQSLSRNAAAPGTFSSSRPSGGITIATSGSSR